MTGIQNRQYPQLTTYSEAVYAATFTGPFAAGQTVNVILKQLGNLVTLEVPAISAAAAAASVATSGVLIPAGLRPQSTIYTHVTNKNNALLLNVPGKAEVTAAGVINIYLDLLTTGAWLAIGANGWDRFSVTYSIA